MFEKIRKRLERVAMAIAFATAGERDTALEMMRGEKQQRKVARKRARREKRLEMRAPGLDG